MTQHDDLARLSTESRHPAASSLDAMDAEALLRAINAADAGVPGAVAGAIPRIARAVEAAYATIKAGGSLFYIGAGTSGRLGVLDASEIPPTYGAAPSVVRGLIAGGDGALRNSLEGAEDDPAQGAADLVAAGFAGRDMLIGVAASGRTPYVLGALTHARGLGAVTAAIACVAPSKIGAAADIAIDVETGPEIVAGSTRMKAGTAQKLILNMISTAAMIRLGKVYRGLMVDMAASNEKLRLLWRSSEPKAAANTRRSWRPAA